LNFLDIISKNVPTPNFTKIRPVGAELFHADRQTDMAKLTVAFRNFANAPKMTEKPEIINFKEYGRKDS